MAWTLPNRITIKQHALHDVLESIQVLPSTVFDDRSELGFIPETNPRALNFPIAAVCAIFSFGTVHRDTRVHHCESTTLVYDRMLWYIAAIVCVDISVQVEMSRNAHQVHV